MGVEPVPADLVERDDAVRAVSRLVEALDRGAGALLVVRGEAGLGKTELLALAARTAQAHGLHVRSFGATPSERSLPWNGARELLGDRSPDEHDLDDRSGDALRGLYGKLSRLAAEHAVLLCVDDVQWLDDPTLRWLHFVARRLEGRPVALLLSCRRSGASTDLVELLHLAKVVDLGPLSHSGVAEMVRRRLGAPDTAFVEHCLQITGGNPFLVRCLVDEVAARGLLPEPGALEELTERPPRAVTELVRLRLSRLSESTAVVAAAAAVAGAHATVARVGELTELPTATVAAAIAQLRDAGLLAAGVPVSGGPTFLHPLEASAALAELSPTLVQQLHLRMAELLHDAAAADVEIAHHLEHCGALGTDWAGTVLLRAGCRAAAARDHGRAVRWLRRALDEPHDAASRLDVLSALARSEQAIGSPAALGRLRAVAEDSGDPRDRVRLARTLALHGHIHEAAAELDALLATTEGPLRARVRREQISTLRQSIDLRPRSRALVEEMTAEVARGGQDPALLAELAYEHALAGTTRQVVADLGAGAMRAAEDGELHGAPVHVLFLALVWAGELRPARRLVELRDRAGDADAVQHHRRAQLALAIGAVEQAHAHGVAALDGARFEAPVLFPAAVAQLARSLVRLHELEQADRILTQVRSDGQYRHLATFHSVLLARAELSLAREHWEQALAEAEACRRFSERMGTDNPVVVPWHTVAAEALVGLERLLEAREIATDALERIDRFGHAPDEVRRPLQRIRQVTDTEQHRSLLRHPSRSGDRRFVPVGASVRVAGTVLRVLGTSTVSSCGTTTPLGTDLVDRAIRFLGVQGAGVHRDRLVEVLWPDAQPGVGRARLRKVLSQLRRRHGDILESTGDALALADHVTVDLREFRRMAFDALHTTDDQLALGAGQEALAWYGGELCELDRYDDWVVELREAVRQEWHAVSRRVADRLVAEGELDAALAIIERLVADEPWNEEHLLVGARWSAQAGRVRAARAFIERARAAAAELGVPASPELDGLEAALSA